MKFQGSEFGIQSRNLIAASLTALTLTGCWPAAEQPILDQFFAASRLRDNTALGSFSTVVFEPLSQGIVTTFTITNVTPEKRKALTRETLAGKPTESQRASAESGIVGLSVADPRNPIDVTTRGGELVSKDVTIDAPVRLPSGQTVPKTLVITMQRAELSGDKPIAGRWIITAVRDASGPPATPRS